MTVLGALFFEPGPVEAHEVTKSSAVGIPSMLHKGGKAGGETVRQRLFATMIEGAGQ